MTGLSGVFIKNIFQKAGVLDSGQKAIALSTYIHMFTLNKCGMYYLSTSIIIRFISNEEDIVFSLLVFLKRFFLEILALILLYFTHFVFGCISYQRVTRVGYLHIACLYLLLTCKVVLYMVNCK